MSTRRSVHGVVAAIVVVAAATVLASCADAPVGPPVGTPPVTTAAPPAPAPMSPGERHVADVAYAQAMLPHVVQGSELTAMVAGRVSDPDLARLVTRMDNADAEASGQLAGQLHVWRATVPGERGVPSARMAGMADAATLGRLRTLSGPAFDRAWLAVMIAHHEGGVDMSRDYLARGGDGALAGVAEEEVGYGTAQLDAMRALQTRV